MSARKFKIFIYILEGSNAFATGYYFNWLFFYTQSQLHFGVAENLGLAALHGLIYTGAAWLGGWFGHRFGRFTALKAGCGIMAVALGAGTFLPIASGQIAVVLLWTFGMCFTWPALQALISHGETSAAMPKIAGIYNIVWSAIAAVSFFIGGTLLEVLGITSMFFVPAAIHVCQFVWVFWLEKRAGEAVASVPSPASETISSHQESNIESGKRQKLFLQLALLANPMAYVAINTAIPMIPEVAKRFELTPMWVGFICSVWFFVRMGAFILFWLWPGWHYRFGWLAAAKAALVLSFLGLLFSSQLWILILAQVVFGLSVGLIYYSSLFYSLDGGAAKTKGGGAHEAMIGLGTFLGAGLGASVKYFWPTIPGISIWAVSGLLFIGFVALLGLWFRRRT